MRELYFYNEIEDMHEEMLNDVFEDVDICCYKYSAGRALRLVDETAFRCGFSDWSTEEFEELEHTDLSEEEIEHYGVSSCNTLYARKE